MCLIQTGRESSGNRQYIAFRGHNDNPGWARLYVTQRDGSSYAMAYQKAKIAEKSEINPDDIYAWKAIQPPRHTFREVYYKDTLEAAAFEALANKKFLMPK